MKNLRQRILKEIKTEFAQSYSIEQFKNDQAQQKHIRKEKAFFNSVLCKELKLEFDYLQLIIDKNEQLSSSLNSYVMSKDKPSLKNKKHNSLQLKDFVLTHIVIINNYIAMKDAFFKGLTYQGLVIFRNTIELTELAIGILGNQELHDFYRKTINAKEGEDYQSVKFGAIKKKTGKILSWIKSLPNNNIDPELWDGYLITRSNLYESSSRFSHSNFASIYSNAYVTPLANRHMDVKELVMSNIGGIINQKTKTAISEAIIYESISYMIFVILLVEKYKLPFKYFNESAMFTTVLTKISWDLIGQYIVSVKYHPNLGVDIE